jgi:hypothetical protein
MINKGDVIIGQSGIHALVLIANYIIDMKAVKISTPLLNN